MSNRQHLVAGVSLKFFVNSLIVSSVPLAVILSKLCSGLLFRHYAVWPSTIAFLCHIFRRSTEIVSLRWLIVPLRSISLYQKYSSTEAEDAYWARSERIQRQLSYSDANARIFQPSRANGKSSPYDWTKRNERRISYYKPRLLPQYRDQKRKERKTTIIREADDPLHIIPPSAFVKWHWLVFPERVHPTTLQASKLMQGFSAGDLQEILQIAKSVRNIDIITKNRHSCQKFRDRWRSWLARKGPELVVCFGDDC